MPPMHEDAVACYRALQSRDRRFDGVFYTGVRTTGVYCRPSCPARTPHAENVSFYASAAAAQQAGFRACKRCLPDASPGSPEWDVAADAAARAMRLIADGLVDREGVEGLAHRLGYSVRQLNRLLIAAYGAGPLALARSRRAQSARVLIETTSMPLSEIAFAAGFSSIRQFNDTVREVYDASPTELRGRRRTTAPTGTITARIAVRRPFAAEEMWRFLAARAVPGLEAARPGWFERSLGLPHGAGVVRVDLRQGDTGRIGVHLSLQDPRDLAPALERTRRLLDADCDPAAVDAQLARDARLAELVAQRPGLRVPGQVDGFEAAVRAVIGQQVSLAAARTVTARLVERLGERLDLPGGHEVVRTFPTPARIAAAEPAAFGMPHARVAALQALATAVGEGELRLDRSAPRDEERQRLLAIPGIGPWTADYVSLRALGDPDVFLATDVGVRRACARLGLDEVSEVAMAWRPWRSYALMHLWAADAASVEEGNLR